jgi:plastocyanin
LPAPGQEIRENYHLRQRLVETAAMVLPMPPHGIDYVRQSTDARRRLIDYACLDSRRTKVFNVKRLIVAAALLATVVGCASIRGTDSIADTTRTGTVHTVDFEEHMTPANLYVQPGDEVRWVNHRSTPVTVEFLGDALENVTCQSGFSSLLRRQQETATIKPNESASLCFADVGTLTYNARMESPVAGGQMIESGTIRVGQ